MKESIKKRIEAVRRGEVPEKYNTERAMLFPDEWGTPVILNTVLSENKDRNEDLRFGKEDVLSVSGEQGIVNQIDLLGRSYAGKSVAPYHVVETGDVVYTKSPLKENPYGIIKQNRGAPGIVSTLYAVYHCSTPITGQYLENYFSIDTYLNNYLKPLVKRGAKNDMKVNNDEVLLGRIPLPSLQEQECINEIVTQFDRMIELKQSKIDELKKLKQVCLLEMFPQKGQTIPTRRFPGFSAPWEQRKVSDLAEKTYGGGTPTTSNEAYWNGDIPWIQSSDVVDGKLLGVEPRKWITQDGLNNSAAQLIPGNSIAIITRVGVGKLAFMPYSYATSQDFLSLSKLNAEPLFTVYACYKKLQSELNAVQGTSIKGITKDELLAKNIMVPRYAEQQQIGVFFKQLDLLITLHQRKGKAAVTGCSNEANNSKGVYCKARDFGYKCYKKVKSQQIRCLIAVFIFFV